MKEITIFWFRRDLRLEDNTALWHALQHPPVLPIFIFDTEILSELPKDDARVTFIYQCLEQIQNELIKTKRSLAIFKGKPLDIFQQLLEILPVKTVYANHDYEPYARQRDKLVYQLLKNRGIDLKTCKDQVIFEKNDIVKDDGKPYVVYTPYSKKWKETFRKQFLSNYPSETLLENFTTENPFPFLTLEEVGFINSSLVIPDYSVSDSLINSYEQTRNFPAINGTSHLGIHLRFGTVSIRHIVNKASVQKNETFLNELIWREFFMQILWHFPHTTQRSFKAKYDLIKWRNNKEEFKKWCSGQTGFPFIDAGMRELNATGYMHNRVRMVVAGFLCKHLLIDWRWGEAYFARHLLDFEQASNAGNWQWAAGCGVDAAPYFRIFNPIEQAKKFDPDQSYIKKWIPELGTSSYPDPIVNHKEARDRCLKAYKGVL